MEEHAEWVEANQTETTSIYLEMNSPTKIAERASEELIKLIQKNAKERLKSVISTARKMQQKQVTSSEGLNFNYYSKVGNRVFSLMKRFGEVMAEKLLNSAV